MNANQHTSNILYRSKVQKYSAILYTLNLLCFSCLTSVFLYGAYSLFTPNTSYLFGILILVLISVFNNKFLQKPYWYLRPKINQVLFANIYNSTTLVFALLCLTLLYFNYQTVGKELEFGVLGASIFIIGLPLAYYAWMVFSQPNQKSIVHIIDSERFMVYKNYELYIALIFIALFGLIYDYLPQNIETLLYFPIVLLIILSVIIFVINNLIHKAIINYFEWSKNSEEKTTEDSNFTGLYEKHPYHMLKALDQDFFQKTFDEQKYLLFTLKRISAIDANEELNKLLKLCEKDNPIYNILSEIHQYLSRVSHKLSEIKNPYEFIEQSNDIVLIKALVRNQISNRDKNLTIKLLNDNRISVKKPACIVAGYYDDINIISTLIEHLENPDLSHWAQLALGNIGEKSIKYLEIEFSKRKQNMLFVESCFGLICRIGGEEGFKLLFKSLNETDSNIRKIAAKKIIIHNVTVTGEHRKYFKKLFDDLILTLLSNSYLIGQLERKNENFTTLKNAIENENEESLHLIINIIQLYYNSAVAEQIFENYGKKDLNLHAASNLLIDLLISDNITVKNKIKLLFSPKERLLLESLQEDFPIANLRPKFKNEEDLIWFILKKEYDQINSWTRTCSLNILQYTYKDDIPFELASEFLNKNQLLKQTAAANIYKNLPEFYTIFLSRLSESEAKQIDYLIRSNLDVASPQQVNQDNLLLADKIRFLSSIPYLKNLSITEIINLHAYFKPLVLKAGDHQISLQEEFNLGFWLIESGNISFSKNGTDFFDYKKRDIFKVSDHDSPSDNIFIHCDNDVRFLIVEEIILMNIISDYDEIMQRYIDILPDKSPRKIITQLKQTAA